jgi:hypothetical protein
MRDGTLFWSSSQSVSNSVSKLLILPMTVANIDRPISSKLRMMITFDECEFGRDIRKMKQKKKESVGQETKEKNGGEREEERERERETSILDSGES